MTPILHWLASNYLLEVGWHWDSIAGGIIFYGSIIIWHQFKPAETSNLNGSGSKFPGPRASPSFFQLTKKNIWAWVKIKLDNLKSLLTARNCSRVAQITSALRNLDFPFRCFRSYYKTPEFYYGYYQWVMQQDIFTDIWRILALWCKYSASL